MVNNKDIIKSILTIYVPAILSLFWQVVIELHLIAFASRRESDVNKPQSPCEKRFDGWDL